MSFWTSRASFYYDTKKELYIYPYDGTDMKSAKATVPTLERMFYIVGEDIDKKVEKHHV
ncbi:MAG: hypothetical protein L6V93_05755 [Clostridiales bacterium]|nr:MAG: hypothetical protein L6V93_05755 [Clostridiales bacterium]